MDINRQDLFEIVNDRMMDFLNVISPPANVSVQPADELYESEECIRFSELIVDDLVKYLENSK